MTSIEQDPAVQAFILIDPEAVPLAQFCILDKDGHPIALRVDITGVGRYSIPLKIEPE